MGISVYYSKQNDAMTKAVRSAWFYGEMATHKSIYEVIKILDSGDVDTSRSYGGPNTTLFFLLENFVHLITPNFDSTSIDRIMSRSYRSLATRVLNAIITGGCFDTRSGDLVKKLDTLLSTAVGNASRINDESGHQLFDFVFSFPGLSHLTLEKDADRSIPSCIKKFIREWRNAPKYNIQDNEFILNKLIDRSSNDALNCHFHFDTENPTETFTVLKWCVHKGLVESVNKLLNRFPSIDFDIQRPEWDSAEPLHLSCTDDTMRAIIDSAGRLVEDYYSRLPVELRRCLTVYSTDMPYEIMDIIVGYAERSSLRRMPNQVALNIIHTLQAIGANVPPAAPVPGVAVAAVPIPGVQPPHVVPHVAPYVVPHVVPPVMVMNDGDGEGEIDPTEPSYGEN